MRKLIYVILFSSIVAISVTGCTEEKVEPSNTYLNGGGGGSERSNP